MSKNKDLSKDTLIKREISRLTNLFQNIERSRRLGTNGLIEEAAYMKITLKELKEEIDKVGPVDEMSQGSYSILREHPALKSYNTMVQRYAAILRQLTDLLPKEEKADELDDFDRFVNSR